MLSKCLTQDKNCASEAVTLRVNDLNGPEANSVVLLSQNRPNCQKQDIIVVHGNVPDSNDLYFK